MKRAFLLMWALATPWTAMVLTGCDDDETDATTLDAAADSRPNLGDSSGDTALGDSLMPIDTGRASGDATTSDADSASNPDVGGGETSLDGGMADVNQEAATDSGMADAADTLAADAGDSAVVAHTINFVFGTENPPLTIRAGESVTWTWSGNHDVKEAIDGTETGRCTEKTGGFDSTGGGASTFTQKFATPGTYHYYCPVGQHCSVGKMYGSIIVQ